AFGCHGDRREGRIPTDGPGERAGRLLRQRDHQVDAFLFERLDDRLNDLRVHERPLDSVRPRLEAAVSRPSPRLADGEWRPSTTLGETTRLLTEHRTDHERPTSRRICSRSSGPRVAVTQSHE